MDTVYLYVKPSLVGTPEKYETVYESDGWRFWTPQQAIDWGWKTLDHDDFLVIGERNGEIVEIYHSDGEKRDHGEEDRQVTIQDILKSFGGELPENPMSSGRRNLEGQTRYDPPQVQRHTDRTGGKMVIIGIDPGKQGAIAEFADGDLAGVGILPETTTDFKESLWGVDFDRGIDIVYCEHAQKHTPGRLAIASVWRSHGIIEGVCAGLGLPLVFVNPTEWKKTVLAGLDWKKNKGCSEAYVRRKYPKLELPKNKQLRSGYCDAICIAEYGVLRNR